MGSSHHVVASYDEKKIGDIRHELESRAIFRENVHQAASNVSAKQILKLVEQIPPSQATLGEAIAQFVNNFQFEVMIELAQSPADNGLHNQGRNV